MHHRQNGGDRIFSEQLLAGHNYDNKAEGVAEVASVQEGDGSRSLRFKLK